MAKPGTVIGWKLCPRQRDRLLERFAPRYPRAVADHVTLASNAGDKPFPPLAAAAIVGRADDGKGVEAMVVTINGTTDRPDGSSFHITWSLAAGRRAVESNAVIRDFGWTAFAEPIAVTITPARL